jgi:hypothetical protein
MTHTPIVVSSQRWLQEIDVPAPDTHGSHDRFHFSPPLPALPGAPTFPNHFNAVALHRRCANTHQQTCGFIFPIDTFVHCHNSIRVSFDFPLERPGSRPDRSGAGVGTLSPAQGGLDNPRTAAWLLKNWEGSAKVFDRRKQLYEGVLGEMGAAERRGEMVRE